MSIEDGKVVTIHYTLKDKNGETIESTGEGEPLAYLHGAQGIIPGLESALTGKAPGDNISVSISPEEGYGPHIPALVQEVPREAFEGVEEIVPGMAFNADTEDGQEHRVVVTAVTDTTVTVDGNHPLAGQEMNFDVDVVSVRDASEEEISHGHAH
ncbi:MAG: peptidylprolyl isomerase [Proteobacteria bacterium]|nr:MAG: peptidylprolyl isomerase [Pseudomonadota bacterium]PIE40059.1 MAG: peptidylprolyl isomerase [Gammaproteobacteria bacterium]